MNIFLYELPKHCVVRGEIHYEDTVTTSEILSGDDTGKEIRLRGRWTKISLTENVGHTTSDRHTTLLPDSAPA